VTTPTHACLTFGELADYWAPETSPSELERIETHVFECGECAARLNDAELLRRRLGETVLAGAFQAFITDSILNTLAHDGVRVRTYSVAPGEAIQCAVWAEDEVVVTRLRGDFTGVNAVSAVMRLDNGQELDRVIDAPVRDGSQEVLMAFSAAGLRRIPRIPMRLTLTRGPSVDDADVFAEYVFDHRGTFDRSSHD
jgi:hypothetical protein